MLSSKHPFIDSESIDALWVLMGWATVETHPDQESFRQGINLDDNVASQGNDPFVPQAQQSFPEQWSRGINRLTTSVTLTPSMIKGGCEKPIKLQTEASYRLNHAPPWIIQYRANPRLEIPDYCLSSSYFRAGNFRNQSYCVRPKSNLSIKYTLKVSKACYSWLRTWMEPIRSTMQKINSHF